MRTHYAHIGKLRKSDPKSPYSRTNLTPSSEYPEHRLSHLPANLLASGSRALAHFICTAFICTVPTYILESTEVRPR